MEKLLWLKLQLHQDELQVSDWNAGSHVTDHMTMQYVCNTARKHTGKTFQSSHNHKGPSSLPNGPSPKKVKLEEEKSDGVVAKENKNESPKAQEAEKDAIAPAEKMTNSR